MATKLPGGRRRYNVKFSRKSVSRLNPYSKSPILNSPTKRSNFASGDRADEPVSPDDASGDED